MTRTGTKADIAATQLRAILNAMASESMEAADAMYRYGYSADQFRATLMEGGLLKALLELNAKVNNNAKAFSDVFPNIRALVGVLDILGDNMEENVRIFQRMKNTTGSLKKAFEEIVETTQFKLDKALATLGVSAIKFGETLKGPVIKGLQFITNIIEKLTDRFENLTEKQKNAVLAVVGLTAAFGPLFIIISRIMMMFANNPILAFIQVVVMATAAIITWTQVMQNANAQLEFQHRLQKEMSGEHMKRIAQVKALMEVAKDENKSLQERKIALQELARIAPEHFGNLDLEKIKTEAATVALKDYIALQMLEAKVAAARKVMTESADKEFKLRSKYWKEEYTFLQKAWRVGWEILSQASLHGGAIEKNSMLTRKHTTDLEKERDVQKEAFQYWIDAKKEIDKILAMMASRDDPGFGDADAGPIKDIVLQTGYLYDLQQKLRQAQGAALAASRSELGGALDLVRVRQDQLALANLATENMEGQLGLQNQIAMMEIVKKRLTGQQLMDAQAYIKVRQEELDMIELAEGGLGEQERIQWRIAEIQEKLANATAKQARNLRIILELLYQQEDAMQRQAAGPSWWAFEEPRARKGTKAYKDAFDFHLKTLEGRMKYTKFYHGEESQMYKDLANEKWQIEEMLRNQRLDSVSQTLSATANLFASIQGFINAQMQAEIRAAGNSKSAKERIEKAYLQKQKGWATAMAIINVAQGITKAIAQGGVLGLITGLLVAAAGAVQIAAIQSQNFAKGGIVGGTSYTGDKVTAQLNSGEMVLTRNQQAVLFSLLTWGKKNHFMYAGYLAPQLKSGGIAYSDMLARIGDYSGVRSNPEVVAPLSDLKQLLKGDRVAGPPLKIELVARGEDLYQVIDFQTVLRNTY
jgi:hypothetical protein